jgi:hypothetical protein
MLFLIMIFAVSVTAAVRESQLNMYGAQIFGAINRGAFGAAAVSFKIKIILSFFYTNFF